MKTIERDLTEEQLISAETRFLDDIVNNMNKEFNKKYDVYITGSYKDLTILAKSIFKIVSPGALSDSQALYILTQFILGIEYLFKYCDGHGEYIFVESDWSNDDFITSGGQYNICQECVDNGYGE